MTYTPDTPLEALAGIGPKKAQAFFGPMPASASSGVSGV